MTFAKSFIDSDSTRGISLAIMLHSNVCGYPVSDPGSYFVKCLDGGQHHLEAEVDQVYVGDGDDDFTKDSHALVEDTVQQLDQGNVP